MVQRITASTAPLALLLLTYRKKLEQAPQMAERAVPARMSLTELARPPILARNTTPRETAKAPRKAIMPT